MEENYLNLIDRDVAFVISGYLLDLNDSVILTDLIEYPPFKLALNDNYLYITKLINSNLEFKDFLLAKYKEESPKDFYSKLRVYRQLINSHGEMEIFSNRLFEHWKEGYDPGFWVELNKMNLKALDVPGIDTNKVDEIYNRYLDHKYDIDNNESGVGSTQIIAFPDSDKNPDRFEIFIDVLLHMDSKEFVYSVDLNLKQFKQLIISLFYYNCPIKANFTNNFRYMISDIMLK